MVLNSQEGEVIMVGDIFFAFIIACMAILVGYPLFKLVAGSARQRPRERRKV